MLFGQTEDRQADRLAQIARTVDRQVELDRRSYHRQTDRSAE